MVTNLHTVGIVGGIGPESTIDYYKGIINGYRSLSNDVNYPHIIVNSINMTAMLTLIDNKDYSGVTSLLLNAIVALKAAGASFAVIASNTPHVVFDDIKACSPIPLISIVEVTCNQALSLGLKKLLLIGTRFTMQNHFYQNEFRRHGIALAIPSSVDQEIVHNIIFPELEEGIVIPEKKARLVALCNEIIDKEQCDGIILGCTELPLMLHDEEFNIKVLNTAQIHVKTIVNKLLE
ncbi:MAG: ygeA 2 [Bacteroidetes bacterium]|nr:ygeA 2 [Bacteroidota bacterium]